MACLPNLIVLDTDYLEHGNYPLPSTPLPHLQRLSIQAKTVDDLVSDALWDWTSSLVPHEGSLQSLSLVSFEISIPPAFITCLIRRHGWSLTQFCVGSAQVTTEVMIYLCRDCPALAILECSVASLDMVCQALSIRSAFTKCLLANNRKSYRTCQEPLVTPVCLVDPSWCRGYGT